MGLELFELSREEALAAKETAGRLAAEERRRASYREGMVPCSGCRELYFPAALSRGYCGDCRPRRCSDCVADHKACPHVE